MKKLLTLSLLLAGSLFAADIPDGYELYDDARSPDGTYALLYPDVSSEKEPPNLLVQLKPYKVLAEIRPGVPRGATMDVFPVWSGTDTVAIRQFRKWGLVGLQVYELDGDKVKRVHPVLDEVRKVFKKDFADRVRKKYPKEEETIIFVSGEGEEDPVPVFEFKGRKLILNFFADNKPNLAPGVHWNATFEGEWNLDTGKLENAKLTPGQLEVRE
jgi:hypothetical protein